MSAPVPDSQLNLTLNTTFAALADPTRRAILARLARGDATVTDLVEPFQLSQPAISKHLKVLERAGLVSRGRDAQFRPVRLNASPLEEAARWIGGYEAFWRQNLDQLERYAKQLAARDGVTRPQRKKPPKRPRHKEPT